MGKFKKYICLLIAVVLLAAVVPTMALAADDPTAIYVSEGGNDTSGKGTQEEPYATLAKAVGEAQDGATIYIMSNLEVNSLARITDKHVTITSYGDQLYTITRGENMSTDSDTARSFYNPAMIEVTTPEGHGASVTLTNITLDDYGRHEGKYYLQAASYSDPYGKTEFSSNYTNSTEKYERTYDNTDIVQDAIIAGYGIYGANADIILGENAVLKNYGGMSAVRVTGGSTLTMEAGSQIIDDNTKANWSPTAGYDLLNNNKSRKAKMDHGAAGAVWVQGTTAELKENSAISGVVGRAIYVDGGNVTVDGNISNITGKDNMWQGKDGVAVHVRGGANVTLGSNSVIDNDNVTTKISSAVFVTNNSSLEMKQSAKICNLNGTAISGRGNHDGTKDNINIIINGEICGIKQGGGNAINLNESDGLSCIIGENALIHDNTVWAGALYAQGQGIVIDLYGEITDNKSTQNTAGIWLAHNFSGARLRMHPGAEITDNFSIDGESAAVIVSAGTFTMNGGKISNNVTYNKNNSANNLSGGVNVRKNGTFIMNGGEITDNDNYGFGGGISYSDDSANARVILNNGTITGNKMNATVVEDDGKYSVSGGISNDITVKNNIANNVNRYISISDDVVIGNSKVYMQKYDFSIKRPGEDVKFGNAATADNFNNNNPLPSETVACDTAVTDALTSQHLTEVVGAMWYQTDKGNLPLTVYDLTQNENYDETKDLYAAVVDTNATGTADAGAKVALYEVDVKANGSFDLDLPGGAAYGTAVVFLQAEDNTTANIITLKPVDLTAYMGGDQGYDAVVDEDGEIVSNNNSLPHPLFIVTGVPDATDMRIFEEGTNKTWTLVKDGTGYYHFKEGADQEKVRVTYTNDKTGATTLNDSFNLENVQEMFNTYTVALYTGEVDMSKVTASLDNQEYAVALGTGKLTVRAVADTEPGDDPTIDVIEESDLQKVESGKAVAVEPKGGTTYTLNNTGVTLPQDAKPSLLFDSIIEDDANSTTRTDALTDRVDEKLGAVGSNTTRYYEAKYLDLVDANNGNAWITSSAGMDIYWGYPEGTDDKTTFKLVHFKNLHRDGENSGYDVNDINNLTQNDIEEIEVENTENGIKFHVEAGNFSPYVLVWEKTSTSHNPGTTPTPDPDPTPDPEEPDQPELERDDHYAYIFGYEDNTIRPENDITRAEVATIFYRLLTDESREAYRTTDHDFTDVSSDAWYVEPVATLAGAGLLAGYEDGSFRPDAPITRAEYAAIATRFDELAAAESNFTDISGHWAEDAINAAYGAGWVGGYEDGTFRPDQNITRAEAMALINRVLERAVDSEGMLDEMTHWSDNQPDAWHYADVQEATHSHTYEREEGEQYETWTALVPHKVF